ncbi:MAG: phage holin family protein [Pseudorhodoplanes sp.]|nr:phage holin family protein [Pseudorhodoplanes sp.]
MNIDSLTRNLRVLWRAEKIMADIQLQHLLMRVVLFAVAALIAVMGLLLAELALFWMLKDVWSAIAAAAVLAGANFALALALVAIAIWRKPGRELEMAREVQTAAIQGLQADAQAIQGEVASFAGAFRNPMESVVPALIVPLATILMKSFRKWKDAPKEE